MTSSQDEDTEDPIQPATATAAARETCYPLGVADASTAASNEVLSATSELAFTGHRSEVTRPSECTT